jgi:polyisoprenoid-binding protein YceI
VQAAVIPATVKIEASLSPAGHFTAEAAELSVEGSLTKVGDVRKAEDVVLDLRTLKTGISLRDQHMKTKYLEVEKFPTARLKTGSISQGAFSGQLMVHGESVPVAGTAAVSSGRLTISFPVKVSSFKITSPKYMGVGVDDEVRVEVSMPDQGVTQ